MQQSDAAHGDFELERLLLGFLMGLKHERSNHIEQREVEAEKTMA